MDQIQHISVGIQHGQRGGHNPGRDTMRLGVGSSCGDPIDSRWRHGTVSRVALKPFPVTTTAQPTPVAATQLAPITTSP